MCGIFGIIHYGDANGPRIHVLKQIAINLLSESQRRGTDASGLCVTTTECISLFKDHVPGGILAHKPELISVLNKVYSGKLRSIIGHTRSKTKGTEQNNVNNHPIVAGDIIGVHNGVIANDDRLFYEFKGEIERAGQVDSEIIFRLINYYRNKGDSLIKAVRSTCAQIIGSYHCAFVDQGNARYVTLFHSAGRWTPSLMLYVFAQLKIMAFASEEFILKAALAKQHPFTCDPTVKYRVEEGGVRIDTTSGAMVFFNPKPDINLVGLPSLSATQQGMTNLCLDDDCSSCSTRAYCFPES